MRTGRGHYKYDMKKPEVGKIVCLKDDINMKAQVRMHYRDNDEFVGVIILPQTGISGNNRFQDWHIRDIKG